MALPTDYHDITEIVCGLDEFNGLQFRISEMHLIQTELVALSNWRFRIEKIPA